MPRRRRNKILIWVIGLGLLNFVLYTISYAYIGGDAGNGRIENGKYYVRGHFLRYAKEGLASEVSRGVWIYSYVHSITIWPTIGLVLCSMLLLARPHIIATMQEDSLIRGQSFVTASMTAIILLTGAATSYFLMSFFNALAQMNRGANYGV